MFEYRWGRTREEVSSLFGEGVRLLDKSYLEDSETGTILGSAGRYRPEVRGGVYVLRWRGKTIGLDFRVERRDNEHGSHPLFTVFDLGTSNGAVMMAKVAHVELHT